jgi:hypothetical protein
MTKYQPLSEHLRSRRDPFWRATFDDLEAVLGFPLPKSAQEKATWWENNAAKAHNRAWLDAGWRVESIDPHGRAVLFHREGYGTEDEVPEIHFAPKERAPLVSRPPGDRLKKVVGMTAAVGGTVAIAAGLGALAFRAMRKK